jgi:hypothetical protein
MNLPGIKADVLVAAGNQVTMWGRRLAQLPAGATAGDRLPRSTAGLLDAQVFQRMPWRGNRLHATAALLAIDGEDTYGFGRHEVLPSADWEAGGATVIDIYRPLTSVYMGRLPDFQRERWRLFRCSANEKKLTVGGIKLPKPPTRVTCRWSQPCEAFARAMVVAEDRLVVAGPPALDYASLEKAVAGFRGKGEGRLCVVSRETGITESTHRLPAPPEFDAMAVAEGRIYVSLANGQIQCWESARAVPSED